VLVQLSRMYDRAVLAVFGWMYQMEWMWIIRFTIDDKLSVRVFRDCKDDVISREVVCMLSRPILAHSDVESTCIRIWIPCSIINHDLLYFLNISQDRCSELELEKIRM
jgi:hypothetical protein